MRGNLFIERLSKAHNREPFECGEPKLDTYLRQQASQDIKKHVAAVYVATSEDRSQVIGFYTLSTAQVILSDLPSGLAKSLPRYPNVPAYRIGRLATDRNYQGKGIGTELLMDALFRCLQAEIPAVAVIVDAKNDHVVSFYKKYGFVPFPEQPLKLFIPMAVIQNSFTS